ncbi:MAG TPA: DUF6629 family protein [Polyangia bacterium]|jgi:hypothetical protein|nr:DUF6629 family protein [Polyangia bacterium]
MCFSATGSFGVATVIAGIGAVAITQPKPPSHRMLAAVPLLFAGQQVAEGVVWMTIGHPSQAGLQELAVALFLSFALVGWPMWVPISLFVAERDPGRKRALAVMAWIGVAVGVYAAVLLVRGRPTAHVSGHSIAYSYKEHGPALVLALYLPGYVLPTVVPFFISTISRAKIMGTVLVLSLLATFLIERQALTSVWCFFAAILSVLIVLSIGKDHRLIIKPA